MQSLVIDAVVGDDPEVGLSRQDTVHQPLVDQSAHVGDGLHGIALKVQVIDPAHRLCVAVGNQDALALVVVVAERGTPASGPVAQLHTFLHPAPRTLVDVLPLQLGEHGQDAYHRPPESRGSVEALPHGDERHVVRQEHVLNQIERVLLGTAQAVQLEDQHMGDLAFLRVLNQLCHPRPFQRAAGEAVVHVFPVFHVVFSGREHRLRVIVQPLFLDVYGVAFLPLLVRGHADVFRNHHSFLFLNFFDLAHFGFCHVYPASISSCCPVSTGSA